MSNTNFTPGPWVIHWAKWTNNPLEPIGGFVIKPEGRNAIATLNSNLGPSHLLNPKDKELAREIGEPFLTPEEATANAHLIAAAPDMYTALQPFAEQAKRFIEKYSEAHKDETPLTSYFLGELNFGHLRALLTALSKAEGTNK